MELAKPKPRSESVEAAEDDTLVKKPTDKAGENDSKLVEIAPGLTREKKNRLLPGLVLVSVSVVLLAIGLGTPGWGTAGSHSYGLFRSPACPDGLCAAQVLVVVGLCAALECTALALGFIYLTYVHLVTGRSQYFPHATLVIAIVGALSTIIACGLYGGEFYSQQDPSYSIIIALLGAVLLIVSGVLTFWGGRKVN